MTETGWVRSWVRAIDLNPQSFLVSFEAEHKGVAGVEVYKRGGPDESFGGIISSEERGQGFVTLYDLEIEGHPSYFIGDSLVHNCHQLTGDAKDALLKTIEEPPQHVYFILCTTEVGKVTQTIRSRAKAGEYELRPLHRRDLSGLLDRVVKEEGLSLPATVYRGLLTASEGIPRELLGMLEKLKTCSEEESMELLQHGVLVSTDAKAIIDHLMGGSDWPQMRKVLAALKDSAEDVRRSVLGYMTKVLVGSDNPNVIALTSIEEFSRPFYSTELENKAMLAAALYRCVKRD